VSHTLPSLTSPTRTRVAPCRTPGSPSTASKTVERACSSEAPSRTGNSAETTRRGSRIVRLTIIVDVSWLFGMNTRLASSVTSVV
jgi:hypothetical protein